MMSRIKLFSPLLLLGMFAAANVSASQGMELIPPGDISADVPNIECDRTTCFESKDSQRAPNEPSSAMALDPIVVGPPAAQRYKWKPVSGSCEAVPLEATPGSPYTYLITKPVPVPLGSTHVTLTGSMAAALVGSGANGISGMFGRLEIRRAATDISPTGPWIIADYGYVYTRTGTPNITSRFGKATYIGLESLADLPPVGDVPSMIEVRLAINQYSAVGFVYYSTASIPSPGACKGSLQLAF